MSHILFIEVDDESSCSKLRRFKIDKSQYQSWDPDKRNDEALIELLHRVKLGEISLDNLINYRPVIECHLDDIASYFHSLLKHVDDKLNTILNNSYKNASTVVCFNLMPYQLAASIVDKIAFGIFSYLKEASQLRKVSIVIFTQDSLWFSKSREFVRYLLSLKNYLNFIIIDLEGKVIIFKKSRNNILNKREKEIPRSAFEEVLRFKSIDDFNKALRYETNMNIGHFLLKSSHIRTNYDLEDFVRKNNVFERLYNDFNNLIKSFKYVTIIGQGLEEHMLYWLGDRFKKSMPEVKDFIPYFGRKKFDLTTLSKRVKHTDLIVILTDVVRSGDTLKEVVTFLKGIDIAIPVKCYSIVKMSNSPKSNEINGADEYLASVTIKQPYFHPDDCLLCKINQPKREINNIDDFSFVENGQLTAFDFWEMVKDCNALLRDKEYAPGGQLLHRVDTPLIFKLYKNWLRNVVWEKYLKQWGTTRPEVILTIKNESGEDFSKVVAESFPTKPNIIAIPRNELEKRSELKRSINRNIIEDIVINKNSVLIVDDGINSGGTMNQLIIFSKYYRISIIGALVFDSRLKHDKHNGLEQKMGKKIISLYKWPFTPEGT